MIPAREPQPEAAGARAQGCADDACGHLGEALPQAGPGAQAEPASRVERASQVESYRPLTIERYRKDDGRALILFVGTEPDHGPGAEAAR
ncbi:MAG TPA: hypothetical protein VKG82_03040 [Solirubrobacteraceae bacterium]|nr:hypothetical protein [Solirubrobacteraceae bacterium]